MHLLSQYLRNIRVTSIAPVAKLKTSTTESHLQSVISYISRKLPSKQRTAGLQRLVAKSDQPGVGVYTVGNGTIDG